MEWNGTGRVQHLTQLPYGCTWLDGRPTKAPQTTRLDSVWPEEWPWSTKKKTQEEVANWIQSSINLTRRISCSNGNILGHDFQTSWYGKRNIQRNISVRASTFVGSSPEFSHSREECPQMWTRQPPSRGSKIWDTIEEPLVPLAQTCTAIHWKDGVVKEDLNKTH